MEAKFPLQSPPACRDCGQPCVRKVTAANNANGNARRPYYTCMNRSHGWKFACWDDARDIRPTNPECKCGMPSRGFKAHGDDFYGCPVGACGWVIMAACHFDPEEGQEEMPIIPVKVPDDFEWTVTSDPGESPLCSLCRLVLDTLRGPRDAVSTTIPPALRGLAGCHLCQFATRYSVENPTRTDGTEPEDCYYQYEYDPIDLGQASLVVLKYTRNEFFVPHKWIQQATLACLPVKDTNADESTSQPLGGPLAKAMSLADQWIQACSASHPNCRLDGTSSFLPTRLIDVGEKKIFHSLIRPCLRESTSLPPNSPYVSLSHRWGGSNPIKLEKANHSAFLDHIPFEQLPKTFQDAIIVTQNLGMRYLWIDSLCIVQDDSKDWEHESALMVDVYRNAVCNLTAASSSDSSGGLFLDHDMHLTRPVKARFKTGRDGVVPHHFWPEDIWGKGYHDGPLISRGWVLQERLLSRRNLHFKSDQVAWECRSATKCETFPRTLPFREEPKMLKHQLFQLVNDPNRSDPSIRAAWDQIVGAYSKCHLTFATDKLIAFGGVAHFFGPLVGSQYAGGLWVRDIAYQLCWVGTRATDATYRAPSWSWASTEGPVHNVWLPVHPAHVVQPLEILEVDMDLASSYAYGQVKGGSLRVAGRMTTAKVVFEDTYRNDRRASLKLPNSAGEYVSTMTDVSLSWKEEDMNAAQQQPSADGVVYLLEVLHHVDAAAAHEDAMRGGIQLDSRRAPGSRWLILVPVASEKSTFQRCGTFVASDWQWERFDQACEYFNQHLGALPVHGADWLGRTRYAITIV